MKQFENISVCFDVTVQLLIRFIAFVRQYRKMGVQYDSTSAIQDFQKVYVLVRNRVLNNNEQCWVPMTTIRLIKMCLNEMNNKMCICKHLSDNFPIQNGLKQGDSLSPLLFNFAVQYANSGVQKNDVDRILNGNHQLWCNDHNVDLLGDNIVTVQKKYTNFI
jgi:hypothetical protein